MLMTFEERRQMISRMLTPRSDVKADSIAIADRALWSWERIGFHLTPLVGEAGFHSLYLRAIHLTLAQCGYLTPLKAPVSTESLLHKLKEDLSKIAPSQAEQCSNILLNKFTELVSSMVGDSLMEQILRSAWDEHSAHDNARESNK